MARVDVTDYGAQGDGVTLDNQPWIDALAAAGALNGKVTVWGQPGAVYKLTGGNSTPRFNIPSNVTVDLNGSTCDFSTSGDFTIGFGATGTVPSSGAGYEVLSQNVAQGDWEFRCTNASEFADGDWVKIASEGDEGAGTGKKGEINRVVVPVGHCAAMNNSQTTITLGATAGNLFGNTNSGGGRVRIDNELIDYKVGSIATLTGCTRGVGGTTRAAHPAGSTVTFVPASDQVLLQHPIVQAHGYTTADTAFAKKITPMTNVGLRNGRIIGPGNVAGDAFIAVRFIYTVNARFDELDFEGCNSINISLGNSVFGTIEGCTIYKSTLANPASANLGYGILLNDATQDCTISNNRIMRMRHCVAHGNSEHGYPRRNLFIGNHFLYASGDNIDTHSPTDDLHFVGNIFIGGSNGIVVRCSKFTAVGNHFELTNGPGIQCHYVHESAVQWKIQDNKIIRPVNGVGIQINADRINVDGTDFIQITGNAIDCGVENGINVSYTAGGVRKGVMISDNVIANCPELGIDAGLLHGAVISNNVINRPHGTRGILLVNSEKCVVSGNVVDFDSLGSGIGLELDNCDDLVVSGNVVGNALVGVNAQSDCSYCRIEGNNLRGCTTEIALNGVTTHTVS